MKILSEIRNNPNITKPQLSVLIGIGKTAIDNNIAKLIKYGHIERVGSKWFFRHYLDVDEAI